MATQLTIGPPKFGPGANGQGPVTVRDWEVFYRWLTLLAQANNNAFTGTINFPGGFLVGPNTFFNMVFEMGVLKSVS